MYESPLQVDNPIAVYRVHCPTCRQNIWAGLDEPDGQGDDILAAHACPGPELESEPAPRQALRARTAASAVADEVTGGQPSEPAPPLGQ